MEGLRDSAQVRFIHESLIRLIEQDRVAKILADDTALVTLKGTDQDWIIWDWMPRAIAAGLRFAASKSPKSFYGRTSVNRIQVIISPQLTVRSFENLAAARAWLCHAHWALRIGTNRRNRLHARLLPVRGSV
jgi:hypothetical protein